MMKRFSGGSKVQMERLYAIYDRVKSATISMRGGLSSSGGHYGGRVRSGDHHLPNCSSLADELEVSSKTITRDIQFMVDRLGVPMEYDARRHGYMLGEEGADWGGLKNFEFGVEDLAALFLAKQALRPIKETKLAKNLQPAFERLSGLLEGKVNLNWNDLDTVFSMQEMGTVDIDLALFGKLAESAMKCQEVTFDYKKIASSVNDFKHNGQILTERRHIHPYHVGDVGGGWYLIGYDVNRNEIRTFALQRMKNLRVLKARFEPNHHFQIEQYLGGSLGIWGDSQGEGRRYRVEIEVCGWVAQLVQERRWHESQHVRLLGKGKMSHLVAGDLAGDAQCAVVSFQLGRFEELVQLVLGWGRNAVVLKPKKLRNMVEKELREMLGRYE